VVSKIAVEQIVSAAPSRSRKSYFLSDKVICFGICIAHPLWSPQFSTLDDHTELGRTTKDAR